MALISVVASKKALNVTDVGYEVTFRPVVRAPDVSRADHARRAFGWIILVQPREPFTNDEAF